MKTILTFIIVFGVIVFIHEFGHFFFAKRAGILVREFAIGMGPKIFAKQGKDGTAYTIRALPIGGYVRMAGVGEDDPEMTPGMPIALVQDAQGVVSKINTSKKVQLPNAFPLELVEFDLEEKLTISGYINGDESQLMTYPVNHDATIIEPDGTEVRIAPTDVQFQSAPLLKRMMTNFAGPMNNFLLTLVLFIVLTFMQGGVSVTDTNALGEVMADGVAQEAGLEAGDQIVAIDGQEITSWEDITQVVSTSPGEELSFEVQRGDETFTTPVTPEAEEVSGTEIGKIGVQVPIDTSFGAKLLGGVHQTIDSTLLIFQALGDLIMHPDLDKLGGPVMMFQMSSVAANDGVTTVIYMMAVLSVNLGIFNLLPIPALDGGKLLLNVIEGIRGKPMSQEKEGILTLIGFGLLMVLMVLVTWNDFQRYFF